MLRDLFSFFTSLLPIRIAANEIDTVFDVPYKIEPPPSPRGPAEVDEHLGQNHRKILETDDLIDLYHRGAFLGYVTIHLDTLHVEKIGGCARVIDATNKDFLGYATLHTLIDLLQKSKENADVTITLPNPNAAYINMAIVQLQSLEENESFIDPQEKIWRSGICLNPPSARLYTFPQREQNLG